MPRLEDLDPATRRLVEQSIGRRSSTKHERKRARPSRAGAPDTGGVYRCECGETFTRWAAADRHPAGPGHTRMETLPAKADGTATA